MPTDLLDLFAILGIDPEYESDLFDYGKDPNTGLYRYSGWYNFVGTVVEYGSMQNAGDFLFEFGAALPKPPEPFQTEPLLIAIDFMILLPWVISEPEPVPRLRAT
ncbi:MAG: hypothetical protein ABSG25_00770 [Bryobacteraceae bacterium]